MRPPSPMPKTPRQYTVTPQLSYIAVPAPGNGDWWRITLEYQGKSVTAGYAHSDELDRMVAIRADTLGDLATLGLLREQPGT